MRASDGKQEQALLKRLHQLEEAALAEVFDTYYQPLYRFIYHHVREQRTAEDLAAEVFTRLLDHLRRRRGPNKHLKAWLYRVAYNLCVDHARRSVHRDHLTLEQPLAGPDPDPSDQVDQRLRAEKVAQAIQRLAGPQQAVIILKFLEGMGNAEVAALLGMSVAAVKAHQHRGLKRMRQLLSAAGVDEEN